MNKTNDEGILTDEQCYEIILDFKLMMAGLPPLFDPDAELYDEMIEIIEDLPEHTWDFLAEDMTFILEYLGVIGNEDEPDEDLFVDGWKGSYN